MNKFSNTYSPPETAIITVEAESCIMSLSSIGSNDELLEDPNDYVDFFE